MESEPEGSINDSYDYGRVTGDNEDPEEVPIPELVEIEAVEVESSNAFKKFEHDVVQL